MGIIASIMLGYFVFISLFEEKKVPETRYKNYSLNTVETKPIPKNDFFSLWDPFCCKKM